MTSHPLSPDLVPDIEIDAEQTFGFEMANKIPGFSAANDYVPETDPNYIFDPATTRAILAGFSHNRRVMVQGYHGTGKSTHIEQVAARLNWPCIRINLDSHVSRIDLIGKDAIVLEDGKQVTKFQEGLLPWALQHPVALVFDEYDAGRPDVMFVIQRVLEAAGKLTLLDQNKVITPHPAFRIFATTNTVGLGDTTGLYHGTQQRPNGPLAYRGESELSGARTRSRHHTGQITQLSGRRRSQNVGEYGSAGKSDTSGLYEWRPFHSNVAANRPQLG